MATSGKRRSSSRKSSKKNNSNLWILIGGAVVVVLIAAAAMINISRGSVGRQIESTMPPASQHIANVTDPHPDYTTNPPTYGYHYVSAANGGIYTEQIPDEITVHNLEHGFIVLHYRDDISDSELQELTGVARNLQQLNPCLLMQPRAADNTPAKFVMTAWNWMLELDTLDSAQMQKFFRNRVGRGPEQVCRPM
jgi:hypothetical protein